MLQGFQYAAPISIGGLLGLVLTNLAMFVIFPIDYMQDLIFLALGIIFLTLRRFLPFISAAFIAFVWCGAYIAYVSVPATKLVIERSLSQNQFTTFVLVLIFGFIITCQLFSMADRSYAEKR